MTPTSGFPTAAGTAAGGRPHLPLWPHGARCAVVVTIDVDGDLPFLALDPAHRDRLKSRSVGQYGPDHGAGRLLRVLERLGVAASWFIPGAIAQQYPELVRSVVHGGHELACHGMHHLDFDGLDLDGQATEMFDGARALQEVSGAPVRGFRTPSGEWKPGFPEAMAAAGFEWSSSLPGDDRPFPLGDTGVLELPFRYELEDLQYLGFNLDPPFPPGQSRIQSLEAVRDNWDIEFAAARRFGTMLMLRLNAEIMGTPGRARLLEDFLSSTIASGEAWIATCGRLAAHWAGQPVETDHPYRRFVDLAARES
ncbi:polysaccharide deacetylase family protein [Arthrobacter silvisoli]|uniref:polysaccharide deacetylase family protein n=1 Tax=Arthrobacter silvisoli TaxID=2291022 RepID=UPI000E213933|nr:polysaccharide deacetylase family protein [Arthrobacter silvisoli]